jgi:hypothetical protein
LLRRKYIVYIFGLEKKVTFWQPYIYFKNIHSFRNTFTAGVAVDFFNIRYKTLGWHMQHAHQASCRFFIPTQKVASNEAQKFK